jgi:uncharacterized membrane protein YeaQ/YmgE (transglycosylase-associated protein family)
MPYDFDVFLSYNSHDKATVEEMGEALRAKGLSVWLDKWALRPGFPWQEELEAGVQAARSVAVFVGAKGLGNWQEAEMRASLARARREKVPVIPVLLPGCPEPEQALAGFLRALTWVDLRGGLSTDGLARLVWGITGEKDPRHVGAGSAKSARPQASKMASETAPQGGRDAIADFKQNIRDLINSALPVIVASFVGLAARFLLNDHNLGFGSTIILGMAGSVVGGFLVALIWAPKDGKYHPAGFIPSIVGAMLVLWLCSKLASNSSVLSRWLKW